MTTLLSRRNGQTIRRFSIPCLLAALAVGLPVETTRADSLWGENLVRNASFEEGRLVPVFWSRFRAAGEPGDQATTSVIRLDDLVVRSGQKSLAMFGTPRTTYWQATEAPPIPVTPGNVYRLSGWIKATNVRVDGDQFANCNLLLRFIDPDGGIVKIGASPVISSRRIMGTADWTYVERIVVPPKGATSVRVACTLTCSGSAWFDDVEFRPRVELDWHRRQTNNMVFLYEGDVGPSDDVISDLMEHLVSVENALELHHAGRVSFFKYASEDRKTQLTGNSYEAHFETNQVHSVTWTDRRQMVHVLTEPLGLSVPYLSQGLAVYLAGPWGTMEVHDFARSLVRTVGLLPVKQLIDRSTFMSLDASIVFPQAASFVGFLLDEYGAEKLKTLYPSESPKESSFAWRQRFKKIYGADLERIEKQWWDFLIPAESKSP